MLLSVIVPVYNVERYLARCLDSVIGQDLAHCEIILVDDGSTDSSGSICDAYADKCAQISVIHQCNGGLSAARNAGMERAKGQYFMLLDSDDFLEENSLKVLKEELLNNPCDVLVGRAKTINDNGLIRDKVHYSIRKGMYSSCEYLQQLKQNPNGVTFCAQFSIYNAEFIKNNGLSFYKGVIHEDELWTPQVLLKANAIYFSDVFFYYHYVRMGSIMHSSNGEKRARSLFKICGMLKDIYAASDNPGVAFLKDRCVRLYLIAIYNSQGNLYGEKLDRSYMLKNAYYFNTKVRTMLCISPKLYYSMHRLASKCRKVLRK